MLDDSIEPIKAERRTVPFFEGLEVDGYYMPDGEYRIGLESASRILGYGRDWLSAILRGTSPGTAKALRGLGFSDKIVKVQAYTDGGNSFLDRTISLDDFNRTIVYAVSKGKKAALALQLSLTRVALTDFFIFAFGHKPLTIEEKRRIFYEEYARSISPEDWRNMDRVDILRLALIGDEPHLKGGLWNDFNDEEAW